MSEARDIGKLSPQRIAAAGLCIGCGACAAQANQPDAAMRWNRYGQLQPGGSDAWRRRPTTRFSGLCPFSPAARNEDELAGSRFARPHHVDGRLGRFEAAYVGHAAEGSFRADGSSGGMVSWVAAELLRRGLVDGVAHVAAADPVRDGCFFRYRISRSVEEVRSGTHSRYYPVEMSGVLKRMRAVPGRYAVIGIPCFIKAVHLLRAQDEILRERIAFTLGLFCGHMKSARMVESFAWQMGTEPARLRAVEYRIKDPGRPANWYRAELALEDGSRRQQDWWHLVDGDWGSGFFQNPACDFCDDVVAETADISFGDAWAEPYSSDGRGTNVVVVRSALLDDMLRQGMAEGRLAMEEVDAEFVVQTQAAGFRQRREGLAWRLARRRYGLRPRKRVVPCAAILPLRRRLIYGTRQQISRWSHRMFWLARCLRAPAIYLWWGRAALGFYHALAYSRTWLGRVFDGIEQRTG